ncbi:MAG: polyphenol oxidase family protein [Bacteriovoracaceae bacterium]|nr:polyphenol oxidase family protein [Bacteriovoracaceae bacterium]
MAIVYSQLLPSGIFEVHNSKPNLLLKRVKQTHSDDVVLCSQYPEENEILAEADALIDQDKKHILAILTADCIPVLFLGEKGNAFVHAGWMGVKNQISLNSKIQDCRPHTIFLGPHIRGNSFEVQPDFKTHFNEEKYYAQKNQKLFFDLTAKLISDLKIQYPKAKIIDSEINTFTDERFHSYRRNKTVLRNWNVFIPRETR